MSLCKRKALIQMKMASIGGNENQYESFAVYVSKSSVKKIWKIQPDKEPHVVTVEIFSNS